MILPKIRNLRKYIVQRLIPAILISIAGILFLNYFLAYRLESYLKKELGRRTMEATDGFYHLTFSDLSIHLLSGELKIEGIELKPDSAVFHYWESIDSLPLTYVNARIGTIDFKGINLIWLRDYRQLHFESFEIADPDIDIYDAYYSERFERKTKNVNRKTFHEIISPYIDVLTVRRLNLENASVSFMVEHPVTPIIYMLEDVSLHAYRFRLDADSYEDGKLLYSEYFDFTTNRPQRLLTNNDFVLDAGLIRLSTKDSLIQLHDIRMIPQETVWRERRRRPVNYIEGEVERVEVKGIVFSRENARNSLDARSFEIDSADIQVVNLVSRDTIPDHRKKDPAEPKPDLDSLVQALSLYDLIAPLFDRVAIEHIGVDHTKMNYAQKVRGFVDTYSMEDFRFHAYDFLIDSVSESRRGLWYARNFSLDIAGLEGLMSARNHRVDVDRLELDTRKGILRVEHVDLSPLSTRTADDYLSAKVDTLSIEGLLYEEGIEASLVRLTSPDIRYAQAIRQNKNKKPGRGGAVEDIFNPLLRYFAVRDIRIEQGNVMIRERRGDKNTFNLRNFDFYAHNFLMNERTWNNSNSMLFECDEYGFSFRNFDNYLQNKNYRLTIRDGAFSTRKGNLQLADIALVPQEESWEKTPDSYIRFTSPLVRLTGLNDPLKDFDFIKVDSVSVDSPDIKIIKANTPEQKEIEEKVKEYTPFSPFKKVDIGGLTLRNTQLVYENRPSGEELEVRYDQLHMSDILWNTTETRTFDINRFEVSAPQVSWNVTKYDSLPSSGNAKTLTELVHPFAENIRIRHFASDRIGLLVGQPYMKLSFDVKDFILEELDWQLKKEDRAMDIERIYIGEPTVNLRQTFVPVKREKSVQDTVRTSIYDQLNLLGEEISVGSLNVVNANIDYENQLNDTVKRTQMVNRTDFSIAGVSINNRIKEFAFDDISFYTKDLTFPISNGFYDIKIGDLRLQNDYLELNSFHMVSPYPKTDFAYLHPTHQDWFDVSVRRLQIEGMELPALFSGDAFYAKTVRVDDPVLLNYKNKKIYTPPRWMPMIYEGLQKAPIKIDIDKVHVNNLGVVYEELAKKAKEPGQLVFTELNGTISGFTNIVSYPEQYFRLDADGKFYGEGHFSAVWLLPVDSLNDRFILDAQLPEFDLTALNEMIAPMASAELKSGQLTGLNFCMDASSKTGSIYMLLLYEDMKINIFKIEDGEKKDKRFLNWLANAVVRDHNPNRPNGKPREVFTTIERDPYHSTFNYLWQMLRPALTESVGITKTQQKIAMGISGFIGKIKKLFGKGKEEESAKREPGNTDEPAHVPLPHIRISGATYSPLERGRGCVTDVKMYELQMPVSKESPMKFEGEE